MKALLDVRHTYHLDVYVHPVNPVLNETRYEGPVVPAGSCTLVGRSLGTRQSPRGGAPCASIVVNEFNGFLERMVLDTVGTLKWIGGLTDRLLEPVEDAGPTAAGVRLRSEYLLDGTHLHPRYIDVLEAALANVVSPPGLSAPADTKVASSVSVQ